MAPHLPASAHALSLQLIVDGTLTNAEIADALACTTRTVTSHRTNFHDRGTTTAPRKRGGRPRSISPPMLDALLRRLREDPDLYLEEQAQFLWEEFGVWISFPTISRALAAAGWSKKKTRRVAKEQKQELIEAYIYDLSFYHSWQLVYVDESGCDKRDGFRRTGWAPRGVTPVQVNQFQRGGRYQILPAYTQNGVLLARVFQGSTDKEVFEDFIEELLCHCNPWPGPNSVLIMDNASFHRSKRIRQKCDELGVRIIFLPPYSPRLNPIEEFFAELKAFIKKMWKKYVEDPGMAFQRFLEWCINIVGAKEKSAKGHFRHAGVSIEEFVADSPVN